MSPDVDARIERLLDQLEDPSLDQAGIEKIKTKIELLREQQT